MKKLIKYITGCGLIMSTILLSCNSNLTGELVPNKSPETYSIVDTIIRLGENRFKTQLEIKWWGADPDGFITGYEFSFDNTNWTFTSLTDSLFFLTLPAGSDTFDFDFYVRAIDNEGLVDPTPAHLVYPVKNSPPDVKFLYSKSSPARKPVRTLPAFRFVWEGSDPDGIENIDHYDLYMNDTNNPVFTVDAVFNSIMVVAENPDQSSSRGKVYEGNNLQLSSDYLSGMILNDTNLLYIQAVDLVGEKSPMRNSYKFYVVKKNSNILIVNAYSNNFDNKEKFYLDNFNAIGVSGFDLTRVNEVEDGRYTELAYDNLTQTRIFNFYDVIIWFGKEVSYSMSLAQRTTDEFFNQGGRMFLSIEIANSIDEQASFLDFSPIDSLVSFPSGVNGFRINKGEKVNPRISGWPTLKTPGNKFLSVRPFYEDVNSIPLYEAVINQTSSTGYSKWLGKSTIMAKRVQNGKTNFIISTLELQNLSFNNNMDSLFTSLFVDELKIK